MTTSKDNRPGKGEGAPLYPYLGETLLCVVNITFVNTSFPDVNAIPGSLSCLLLMSDVTTLTSLVAAHCTKLLLTDCPTVLVCAVMLNLSAVKALDQLLGSQ